MAEKCYLAFDVGGTTIKYALLSSHFELLEHGATPTLHNQDEHILKTLLQLGRQFLTKYPLAAVGVSTAGIVAFDGSIQYAGPTIPGYTKTPLKQALVTALKLPVFVVNDVSAALLGESLLGAAKNATSAYCVALGTGIGGAFLTEQKLFSGAHNTANSLGYTLFDPQTKTYFEQRASTLALESRLAPLGLSVKEAFAQAKANDQTIAALLNDWALEVALGLSEVLLLFDPEVLVLAGAVSLQGDFLCTLIQTQLEKILPQGLCHSTLKAAQLGDKAQLYGALYPFLK